MGLPRTDLNLGQNSKSKFKKNLYFVLGSTLSEESSISHYSELSKIISYLLKSFFEL